MPSQASAVLPTPFSSLKDISGVMPLLPAMAL